MTHRFLLAVGATLVLAAHASALPTTPGSVVVLQTGAISSVLSVVAPDGSIERRLLGDGDANLGDVAAEGSSTVWLTVACEGRLASDPRTEPGYIEAVGGTIYELSRSGGAP